MGVATVVMMKHNMPLFEKEAWQKYTAIIVISSGCSHYMGNHLFIYTL